MSIEAYLDIEGKVGAHLDKKTDRNLHPKCSSNNT
jgi:hypothetical protein